MGLNEVPAGERVKIGFFGRRNAGKSSLVNAVTGQELSVVSRQKGTTTDAVSKSMELLPLGPVVIIDTPGFDDEGELGEKRVRSAKKILERIDLAVLVTDNAAIDEDSCEQTLITLFQEKELPYLIAHTKIDLYGEREKKMRHETVADAKEGHLYVSAEQGIGIDALKDAIAELGKAVKIHERPLVKDLLQPMDQVILVLPQDKAAPKGRLILPEQMMIRDVLDAGASALCVKEEQLQDMLKTLNDAGRKPAMVITDSQVFAPVAKAVPLDIPLSSFSILMARYNRVLEVAVRGVTAIDRLKEKDKILISEGCTHHRQCGDIGTVKLPALLKKYTGKELCIETTSGHGFPDDLSDVKLVLHCGGCMLGEREMMARMERCRQEKVPYTNYGTAIAYMRGILERSLGIFPDLLDIVKEAHHTE